MVTASCNRIHSKDNAGGWQRWHPGVLDAAPRPQTRPESEDTIMRRAHNAGLEAGKRAGFQAGYAEGQAQAQAQAAQIRQIVQSAEQALHALGDTLAAKTAALAVAMARKILLHEIETRPETIIDGVRAALDLLPEGAERVRIVVNTADVDLLRRTLMETADAPESIVTGSDDIQRGGCRISSPCGDIDATLETRMQRILESLGLGQDATDEH